jgi:hypothetical protein
MFTTWYHEKQKAPEKEGLIVKDSEVISSSQHDLYNGS